MATLDISGALNAIVQASTPQAQMEQKLAKAMFSDRVAGNALRSVETYENAGVRHRKLLSDEQIDPAISAECMAAYKQLKDDNVDFHGSYYH